MNYDIIVAKLAETSPYALLLVLGFSLFYFMFRRCFGEVRFLSEHSIKEIRTAYEDSYKKLMDYLDRL